ncbi:hypothetical protein ACQKKX_14590 [Neorhizobium sp. NPDC001467]|uniref:hypothetical protein n=1 Tax=Neorhizobium sp. NPDC001467 TaxID=3390595 RepID=UPI003D071E51
MLPPLPALAVPALPAQATPSAPQANARQTSPLPQITDGEAQASAPPAAPPTTRSADLLDLSGQLRLGQSLSVFAETLGSLLDLPRHEGETLADYSRRLAAAIQALGSAERARLQALLDQTMQGITVKLLSELLKDPTGPAAARLAVRIEVARAGGVDIAAGHAVQSYRQNNGVDIASTAGALLATNNSGKDTSPGKPDGMGTLDPRTVLRATTTTDRQSEAASTLLATTRAVAATAPDSAEGSMTDAADAAPGTGGDQDGGSGDDAVDGRTPRPGQPAGKPVFVGTGPGPSRVPLSAPPTMPDAQALVSTEPDGKMAARPQMPPMTGGTQDDAAAPTAGPPIAPASALRNDGASRVGAIYDAAALARSAHARAGLLTPYTLPTAMDLPDDGQRFDIPAEKPEGRALRPTSAALPNAQTGVSEVMPGKDRVEDGGVVAPRKRPIDAVDRNPLQPVVSPMPTTTLNAAGLARQADTAFEKALLGMMLPAREPPAHPLVPRAAGQDFDDERDHAVRRKPAVGDDGQPSRQGSGGEHSSRQEKQPARDAAAVETVLDQIVIDDIDEMTEHEPVTATAGLRQAPQQHLSSRAAPTAEDFYRRLAILE